MRLLVTGPGKLGTRLLPRLARQGVAGRVLYRRAAPGLPDGWEAVRGDLTVPASLAGAAQDCDAVLHLAALTHSNDARRYVAVNAAGTGNLLAEARRAGVRRFLHVSTRAIDPAGGAYSRSKIRAEALVRESGIPWTILRPAEVYGAAGGEGLQAVIERVRAGRWVPIAGDGSYRLAPVFVEDVIDGLCAAVRTPAAGCLFHLAGPEEIPYARLIDRLATHYGTRPRRIRVPAPLLHAAARALALLPLARPPLYADQIPRLRSPKPYEIEAAAAALAFRPRRLEDGLDAMDAIGAAGATDANGAIDAAGATGAIDATGTTGAIDATGAGASIAPIDRDAGGA